MSILEKLNNNTILICLDINKKKILDELYKSKKLIDFKIMNLNEFIKKMTFDYDTKTIYYLMKNYNLSYENALIYIKSLYYVSNKNYKSEKLLELVKIKEELKYNNLLIFDTFFKESIKDKKIIFYNENADYKYLNQLLDGLSYEVINDEKKGVIKKKIYHFHKIEDEINYVAEEICNLIGNNIDLQHIKLANISKEYEFLIPNLFKQYGLKIDVAKNFLYETPIGKYFLDNLDTDINKTIEKLKEIFLSDESLENINRIINICNKYSWCDNFLNIKDMLIYELKNTNCFKRIYDNELQIINLEKADINDDDYIFLLGFNEQTVPHVYKDDEYITDKMKLELGIETSYDKNKRTRENFINIILSIKNLIITYKDKTNSSTFYISSLNDDLKFEIIEKVKEYTTSHSILNLKIDLCKQLDEYVKYGVKSDTLDLLFSHFSDLPYKKYDNNYTKIDKEDLIDYLDKKLLLSYTSIDNYYKCQFKYYINNILKLDPFEETFSIFVGNLMHHMLQICFNPEFNYDKEYDNYILNSNYSLTPKDKFFLKKIKEELKSIIDVINKQKLLTNFNHELYEQKIFLQKNHHIKITFMGIIDKIMYMQKDGKTYLSIVDYKTGDIKCDLKNIKHGLTLQLPIYAYLVKNSHLFKNPIISGLYYQKLLSSEIEATTIDDYNQKKYDELKLIGLSTNNEDILKEFDNTYENSSLIKSMKKGEKGFYAYSKIYSEDDLKQIIDITEEKIDEAIEGILDASFRINPKQVGKENISCKYCKYKDVCYMTENNKEIIEGD